MFLYTHAQLVIGFGEKQNIQTRGPTKIYWRPSRWRRSETWRSPSSPQIHQKYIYMWNNSYRTPTERWQKTSDFPKGKKLPTYLGRAKEKRKSLLQRFLWNQTSNTCNVNLNSARLLWSFLFLCLTVPVFLLLPLLPEDPS